MTMPLQSFADALRAQASGAAAQVTVIIPTFNRCADVVRALRSLSCQSAGVPHVIVVDNSSTDATAAQVKALVPEWQGRLRYVRRTPNGPSSARNTGLTMTTTHYVLFHDSDIELPPHWIDTAIARMAAEPALGAVGGLILYAYDEARVNAYGGDMGRFGLAWDVDEGKLLASDWQPAYRIWINCSAMLADAEAVRRAQAFDERYFYGYEDSDLGWRLNLTGRPVVVLPTLHACHHVDAAPGVAHGEIVFHYCKNRLRTILKNAAGLQLPLMLAAYACYSAADLVLRQQRRAKLRALGWNVRHLHETLSLRRAVQGARKVNDAGVLALGSGAWFPPSRLDGRRRRPSSAIATVASAASDKADDRL